MLSPGLKKPVNFEKELNPSKTPSILKGPFDDFKVTKSVSKRHKMMLNSIKEKVNEGTKMLPNCEHFGMKLKNNSQERIKQLK